MRASRIPKSLLQELVTYYSTSAARTRPGIASTRRFALPAGIREIDVGPGRPSSSSERCRATRPLPTPLGELKGVGPRRAADLERAGLRTVGDLLRGFPLRYEDRAHFREIASAAARASPSTIAGTVVSCGDCA